MRTRVLVVPHHPARCDAAAERGVRVDAHARPDELVLRVLTCAGGSLPLIGSAGPQQRVRRAHERGEQRRTTKKGKRRQEGGRVPSARARVKSGLFGPVSSRKKPKTSPAWNSCIEPSVHQWRVRMQACECM